MLTNNKHQRGRVGLALLFWLALATLTLAQEPVRPVRPKSRLSRSDSRPRRVLPLPNANRPSYTRSGTVRKLSPDQLWDAKPDSTRPNRGPFRLLIYASLGGSMYSAPVPTPGILTDERIIRTGVPLSFRALWQTDHRLRLGVETGYAPLYSYRGTARDQPARVRISAIPVLAVFSMSVVRRFSLYAGTGGYIVNSKLDYNGSTRGSTFSLGWMAAGTYTQPITKNLGLAAELKWYDAAQTDDACFVAQATLVWRALTW